MEEIIDLIIENNGSIPDNIENDNKNYRFLTKETRYVTRYFIVELDSNGNVIETDTKNIATVTNEDIENIVKEVLNNNRGQSNYYENYKYRIVNQENHQKRRQNRRFRYLENIRCYIQGSGSSGRSGQGYVQLSGEAGRTVSGRGSPQRDPYGRTDPGYCRKGTDRERSRQNR